MDVQPGADVDRERDVGNESFGGSYGKHLAWMSPHRKRDSSELTYERRPGPGRVDNGPSCNAVPISANGG
jgi:hypothetical protein